jgi:hypothetical protein
MTHTNFPLNPRLRAWLHVALWGQGIPVMTSSLPARLVHSPCALQVYEPKQYPYLRPEAVAAEVAATEWQPLELPGAVNMEGVTAAGAAVAESPASSPGGAPVLPSLQVLRLGLSGLQVLTGSGRDSVLTLHRPCHGRCWQ